MDMMVLMLFQSMGMKFAGKGMNATALIIMHVS